MVKTVMEVTQHSIAEFEPWIPVLPAEHLIQSDVTESKIWHLVIHYVVTFLVQLEPSDS